MAIIRLTERPFFKNPWEEFDRFRKKMDLILQEVGSEANGYASANVFPSLNISEDDNELFIRAEVPGVNPEDVDISLEEDTLTLKGERKPDKLNDEASYHRRELEYGKFSRAISLPTRVNKEAVEAKVENGLLTITLPKAEEVKPKQITVKAA